MKPKAWKRGWVALLRAADSRSVLPIAWWLIPVGLVIGATLYGYLMTHPNIGGIDSPRQAVDSAEYYDYSQ